MNCPILSTQKSHYDSFQVSTSIYNIFYYFYYFSSVLINLYTILLIRFLSYSEKKLNQQWDKNHWIITYLYICKYFLNNHY